MQNQILAGEDHVRGRIDASRMMDARGRATQLYRPGVIPLLLAAMLSSALQFGSAATAAAHGVRFFVITQVVDVNQAWLARLSLFDHTKPSCLPVLGQQQTGRSNLGSWL